MARHERFAREDGGPSFRAQELADNGSPRDVSGAPDGLWNDDVLHALGQIRGTDFEVVDTAGFATGP